MYACTCQHSAKKKPVIFSQVITYHKGICIHCDHYAVKFPDNADLSKPRGYLFGELGNKYGKTCTMCNTYKPFDEFQPERADCTDCCTERRTGVNRID
jgi:hypothetical protein